MNAVSLNLSAQNLPQSHYILTANFSFKVTTPKWNRGKIRMTETPAENQFPASSAVFY